MKIRKRFMLAGGALLLLTGCASTGSTSANSTKGQTCASSSVGPGGSSASALVQQPDDKIVATGFVPTPGFVVARYNSDGSLDRTFGHRGGVGTRLGSLSNSTTLVLEPDCKLVVAGTSGSTDSNVTIALVRYNPDGSLDRSFGHAGKVTAKLGKGVILNAIDSFLVRQPDGKLVVSGLVSRGSTSEFALLRYNPDGSLDRRFGHGGMVTTRINQFIYFNSALVLQADGKLIAAAGTSSAQTWGGIVLVRYNQDGSVDRSFGRRGRLTVTGTTDNDTYAGLALLPNGDLVTAGADSNSALMLAAFDQNGQPDTSFGRDGQVMTNLSRAGSMGYDGALIATPDGKLLAAGTADFGPNGLPGGSFLVRYNSDGSLDQSFGHRGEVNTTFDEGLLSRALLRQRDGKVVVSGGPLPLARFEDNGSLDTAFGKR